MKFRKIDEAQATLGSGSLLISELFTSNWTRAFSLDSRAQ